MHIAKRNHEPLKLQNLGVVSRSIDSKRLKAQDPDVTPLPWVWSCPVHQLRDWGRVSHPNFVSVAHTESCVQYFPVSLASPNILY